MANLLKKIKTSILSSAKGSYIGPDNQLIYYDTMKKIKVGTSSFITIQRLPCAFMLFGLGAMDALIGGNNIPYK